jgi:2-polyprenyl-3-methyl-5-hydroxy-6-metoxy-1,4-benzoquinol methylase
LKTDIIHVDSNLDTFSCYYCSSAEGQVEFDTQDFYGDKFKVVKCEKCSTFNLYPRPTEAQLDRAYNADYYGNGDKKFNPLIEGLLLHSKKRRARWFANKIGSGRVLDIGCADGSALSQFKHYGNFQLEGSEIEATSAERAAKNNDIKLHIGKLKELTLENEAYSVVLLNHVYEHLDDPKYTLERCAELMVQNGILMIAIPNIESIQAKWFKGNWFHLDPPRHLHLIGRDSLVKILKEKGFELVNEYHDHFEYNPFGFQQSMLNLFVGQRDSLYEFLKGNKEGSGSSAFSLLLQRLFVAGSLPFFWLLSIYAASIKHSGTMELYFKKV